MHCAALRKSRPASANDNENLAVQWPQNELEKLLGCNSPDQPVSPRRSGKRSGGRRTSPSSAAALFRLAILDALSWRWLFVYGVTAAVLFLLKNSHS